MIDSSNTWMKIRQHILEVHIVNIKYAQIDIQVCHIHIYCGEKNVEFWY